MYAVFLKTKITCSSIFIDAIILQPKSARPPARSRKLINCGAFAKIACKYDEFHNNRRELRKVCQIEQRHTFCAYYLVLVSANAIRMCMEMVMWILLHTRQRVKESE